MALQRNPAREIERKFLLKRTPEPLEQFARDEITQGYLAIEPDGRLHVRLRKKGQVHSLTFKRDSEGEREEREIILSAEQFDALWPATAGRRLTKLRYEVPWQEHTIEIDIYRGCLDGVIVAEVEFADQQGAAAFQPPDWLGEEVTGQPYYSNVRLARD